MQTMVAYMLAGSHLLSAQRLRQRHRFGVWRRHFVRLSAVAITADARRRNAVSYRDERLRIEPSRVEWMRIGHPRDLLRKCSRETWD